jgi:hypothetical protein
MAEQDSERLGQKEILALDFFALWLFRVSNAKANLVEPDYPGTFT